jgi:hypothetical protein
LYFVQLGVYGSYRDKKVVEIVFVRFCDVYNEVTAQPILKT